MLLQIYRLYTYQSRHEDLWRLVPVICNCISSGWVYYFVARTRKQFGDREGCANLHPRIDPTWY